MRAEREVLVFSGMDVGRNGNQHFINVRGHHFHINLSPLQAQYLDRLRAGLSVEAMVMEFLDKGLLIRFGELHDLMALLQQSGLILNASWLELLAPHPHAQPFQKDIKPLNNKVVKGSELNQFPFFHGLNPALLDLFAKNAEYYVALANTRLCVQGQTTRDMFALVSGQAAIFRNESLETRRILAKLNPKSVFGEGGFLLNRPRAADVVTTQDSKVIRIRHSSELENVIRGDQASQLYRCLWTLHAFTHSPLFQKLPIETWNDVATIGDLQMYQPGHLLFSEGAPGASFFVVVQGQVSVWQQGKRINTLTQGHCFGEVSLFASRGVRTATVKTDHECLIVEISPREFYPLLARHLLLAKELEQLAYQRIQGDQLRRAE